MEMQKWKITHASKNIRHGIVIFSEDSIPQNIKDEFSQFNKWLMNHFDFPIQIKLMLINSEKVQMTNGNWTYGIFKYSPSRYPIIKMPIASGELIWDIEDILGSYVHELTHYFQWLNQYEQTDEESERQANYHRYRIIRNYYKDIERDIIV
ncbi:MAG: hypothetical protein ABIJ40_14010 [Bacteroidota bacterium]